MTVLHFSARMILSLTVCWVSSLGLHAATPSTGELPQKRTTLVLTPVGGATAAAELAEFTNVLAHDLAGAGPFSLGEGQATHGSQTPGTHDVKIRLVSAGDAQCRLKVSVHAPSGRQPLFQRVYQVPREQLPRMAHQVSDDLTEWKTGVRGVAASRIACSKSLGSGIQEIFCMDQDGSNSARMTWHNSVSVAPAVSPDGRLAYITYKSGSPEIWGQKKRGAVDERLYPTGRERCGLIQAPKWSPDGSQLAFAATDALGHCDIYVLSLAENGLRRLTSNAGINTDPSWKPDGKKIAFTSDRSGTSEVYAMDLESGRATKLPLDGIFNHAPSWDPSGTKLLYCSRVKRVNKILVYDLLTRTTSEVMSGALDPETPTWSPDGRKILCTDGSQGARTLAIVDLASQIINRLGFFALIQTPVWYRINFTTHSIGGHHDPKPF